MAITSTTSTSSLSSVFTSLISSTIAAKKEKTVDVLTAKRDTLDIKKSVYQDLKTNLSNLQSSLRSLLSTNGSYVLSSSTRKATISGVSSGSTVLSASATSEAEPGTYKISDITLATTHQMMSDRQSTSTSALNLSGNITINGETITVTTDDNLYSLATKINNASFEDDKGVTATVVDNRLTLQAESSGEDYNMTFSGDVLESLGFLKEGAINTDNQVSPGADATFKVNGISVTRSSNKDLKDVIDGVTLNLESDAEGETATLTVGTNTSSIKSAINAFASKFNTLTSYVDAKTKNTKVDEQTYTRGTLADDFSVKTMRGELMDVLNRSSSDLKYKSLSEIGITFNDDNQLVVSDSSALDTALSENFDDVQALLDARMGSLDALVESYVGDDSIVTYTLSSLEEQRTTLSSQITKAQKTLDTEKETMTLQYITLQAQLDELENLNTTLYALGTYDLIYGNSSSSSSSS